MNKSFRHVSLALRIWLLSALACGTAILVTDFFPLGKDPMIVLFFVACIIVSAIVSLPALLVLLLALPRIQKKNIPGREKMTCLILVAVVCSLFYIILSALLLSGWDALIFPLTGLETALLKAVLILIAPPLLALLLSAKQIRGYFALNQQSAQLLSQQSTQQSYMETTTSQSSSAPLTPCDHPESGRSNKILIKGLITGSLILIMMIPTLFINNLVQERQQRQTEIVKEVSGRWASGQTLTGPYINLPYKVNQETRHLLILPENLHVTGRIDHELRQRSIYKVLLYRSSLTNDGNFVFQVPRDIQPDLIQWQDAKICYSLTDIRGIEDKLVVNLNGSDYELSPELPLPDGNDKNDKGVFVTEKELSAPVTLSGADLGKNMNFHMGVKIKGSEQLHFIPLGGNSSFALQSGWGSPSFDGYNLPTERTVTDNGFTAKWVFNKASLPFGTVLKDDKPGQSALAFGVTMVQPADGYAKADRCVKYAILFIGLTFSLFFIVELLQQKPVHPVQYILIGLALVIFYTLLLALSELIFFDLAYFVSSLATILLISFYARGHFNSWRSAGLFGGILSLLYGFIFVLIRLEDTALLIGSIGLFLILALVMYASRKINWYGNVLQPVVQPATGPLTQPDHS